MKPSIQEHTGWPFIWRHLLFAPQGVGLHGLIITSAVKY